MGRRVALSRGGEKNQTLGFNGYGVLVWEDENILEMDVGDGYITMRTH